MTPEEMWTAFTDATGVEASYQTFCFGHEETPELSDELARLVRDGSKRATAGLAAEYEADGEPRPEVDDYFVVTDSVGRAQAIIRTIWVADTRFGDVDERFAADEGEGDRTLAWWRDAHRRYFENAGYSIDEDSVMVLERFEKLWPA